MANIVPANYSTYPSTLSRHPLDAQDLKRYQLRLKEDAEQLFVKAQTSCKVEVRELSPKVGSEPSASGEVIQNAPQERKFSASKIISTTEELSKLLKA